MLYPLLKDRNIPAKVKTLIYTSILRRILIYGHEAWALTSKTRSQVQAAEMKSLRLIRGVTRLDRMRNDAIREDLGVESILKFIERGQLRWYGHLKRMNENNLPRVYYEWNPPGKRPVGRPRMRWRDNIGAGIGERGSSLEEVEQQMAYGDRLAWRRFVRQVD